MTATPGERRTLFQRAAEAFREVRTLPHADRAAALDAMAQADPRLADEVRSLLKHDSAPDSFIDKPVVRASEGVTVGRYRIIRPIGEGGMGTVYLAEQLEPVRREVALKLIKLGMDSQAVVRRFEAERQTLARMEHPGIARILDGGVAPDGRPYFAMELVRGEPITEWCDKRHLTTAARLRLLLEVCAAVQHAHQKGVIHRDLKPSNLMVTEFDGRPLPKVIDFGIAQALDADGNIPAHHSASGTARTAGTPEYMSPEHAGLDDGGGGMDIRSDVYSLGVVLRELTTRAALAADRTQVPRGDLDWIVRKATAGAPAQRYETVAAFADDIGRFLRHETLVARPAGMVYSARMFARRHMLALSAATVVGAALITGLTMALWGLGQARDELFVGAVERGRLASTNGDLPAARELLWRAYLDRPESSQAAWALRELYLRHPCVWTAEHPGLGAGLVLAIDPDTLVITGPTIPPTLIETSSGRAIAACARATTSTPGSVSSGSKDSPAPLRADLSPDRSLLVVSDDAGIVRLWSLRERRELRQLASHGKGNAAAVFVGDGSSVVTGGHDGRVLRVPLDHPESARLLADAGGPIHALAAHCGRGLLAAGLESGRVLLWRDMSTTPQTIDAHSEVAISLAFDQSGERLATGSTDQQAAIWNVGNGALLNRVASGNGTVRDLAFTEDGTLYLLGWWRLDRLLPGADRPETVLSEGGWRLALPRPGDAVVASNERGGTVRRWRTAQSTLLAPVQLDPGWSVRRVMGGPAELLIASGARLEARSIAGATAWSARLPASVVAVSASGDGSSIAAGLADGTLWARREGKDFEQIANDFAPGLTGTVAVDSAGQHVAYRTAQDSVTLISLAREPRTRAQALPASSSEQIALRFSQDGSQLLAMERTPRLRMYDLRAKNNWAVDIEFPCFAITPLPDGRAVAGSWPGSILIVDPRTGAVRTLRGHSAMVSSVALHPTDPQLLLSGSMDGTVRLWHLGLGRELQSISPFARTPVRLVGFDATGSRVVAATADGRAVSWPLLVSDTLIAGNLQYERGAFEAPPAAAK